MKPERATARYGKLYARLLRLYPKPFRERFGEPMAQTFHDLCRERENAGGGLLKFTLWAFADTAAGIVRERMASLMHKKHILRPAIITACILAVPLVAMQFTDEVAWDLTDFLIGGALLFGAGLAFELVARNASTKAYRAAVGLGVATGLFLIWMNLAVGLIGSEDNPANLLYAGVIVVGIVGAAIARFRPRGMARASFATAIAQALVPVIALVIWKPQVDSALDLAGVFVLNGVFVALFVGSALLFRRASTRNSDTGAAV